MVSCAKFSRLLSLTKYVGTFQGNVKSLQSASMIIGKFIKAKAVKKTDEEVLDGFGAEKHSSDDDSLGQSMRQDGKNKIFYQLIFKKEILICLNLIITV